MAVAQPPEQLAELEHSEEILLQELQRVDEILLEELEHVDEMLLRIAAAIDQLPGRVVAAPARSRASARPFDPYGEDEVKVAEHSEPAARQLVRKVESSVRAFARDREALGLVTLSLAFALLATTIAVVGLVVAVSH
jgi:hypothetical protein